MITKIELNDYDLKLIVALLHLERAKLSPIPSNDFERKYLKEVEDKIKRQVDKYEENIVW